MSIISLSHTHTHMHTHTHTHMHTHRYSVHLSFTHTYTHAHSQPRNTHTVTHIVTHTHSYTDSCTDRAHICLAIVIQLMSALFEPVHSQLWSVRMLLEALVSTQIDCLMSGSTKEKPGNETRGFKKDD